MAKLSNFYAAVNAANPQVAVKKHGRATPRKPPVSRRKRLNGA
jgi:hypothetical protein